MSTEWERVLRTKVTDKLHTCLQVFSDTASEAWATKKIIEGEPVISAIAKSRTDIALLVHECKPKTLVLHIGFASLSVLEMVREIRPDLHVVMMMRDVRRLSVDPVHRPALVFEILEAQKTDSKLHLAWEEKDEVETWQADCHDHHVFYLPPVPTLLVDREELSDTRQDIMVSTSVRPYYNLVELVRRLPRHFSVSVNYHFILRPADVNAHGRDFSAELLAFIEQYAKLVGMHYEVHEHLLRKEFQQLLANRVGTYVETESYASEWSDTAVEAHGLGCDVVEVQTIHANRGLHTLSASEASYDSMVKCVTDARHTFWEDMQNLV